MLLEPETTTQHANMFTALQCLAQISHADMPNNTNLLFVHTRANMASWSPPYEPK